MVGFALYLLLSAGYFVYCLETNATTNATTNASFIEEPPNPSFHVFHFETCEGLVNQRIAIIQGILIGIVTKRRIILPNVHSSFNSTVSKSMLFSELYDVENLQRGLKGTAEFLLPTEVQHNPILAEDIVPAKNTKYESGQWKALGDKLLGKPMKVSCTFNSIFVDQHLQELMWSIEDSLQFNDYIMQKADKVIAGMPHGFTALHLRMEEDWVEHCKHWESIDDGIIRNNCMTNTESIANVFYLENIPTDRPVYLAGAFSKDVLRRPNLAKLRKNYVVKTKDDFMALKLKMHSHRDVIAAIDFEVCSRSKLFVGNSVSTFSALHILKRLRSNMPVVQYNGGNIPLMELLPPGNYISPKRRFRWVFAVTLNAHCSRTYLDMAKVAVLSAMSNTYLEPVCIMMVTDKGTKLVSEFMTWLKKHNVKILEHVPVWASRIRSMVDQGMMKNNSVYSPLYASADALIGTFLRIDLPLLGFVDEYVLYADVDTLFIRNLALSDFEPLPLYYLMGTESYITRNDDPDGTYGNAGVMLYNVLNMRKSYDKLLKYIFNDENVKNGLHFGPNGPGDQGAYNGFYRTAKLSTVRTNAFFNWRPYWPGIPASQAVAIVHWHGPKPIEYKRYFDDPNAAINPLFASLLAECNRQLSSGHCWQWVRLWFKLLDRI